MKKICITEMKQHVLDAILCNEIPFLRGSPGIAKSALFAGVAKELNLQFIDFRLSMCDQTSLNGFPLIENSRSGWAPPIEFPLNTDPLPEGKDGWLISFEEINSAPMSIQAIAYKILHDRMIGNFKLHDKVYMVANGNLDTDGAVVMPLSSALASRMVQFECYVNPKKWLNWANEDGRFNQMLLDYLDYRPEMVHNFNPKSSDPAFPCPRTHEKASKYLTLCENQSRDGYNSVRPSIEGVLGESCAQDLYSFLNYFDLVIPVEELIKNPMQKPPSDIGIRYATLINCANKLDDNIENVIKVVSHFQQSSSTVENGYGIEFPAMLLKRLIRKHSKLIRTRDESFGKLLKQYKIYLTD